MQNKYIYCSKISEKKFREILRLFCFDIEAIKVKELTNISRQTINIIFGKIRERIAEYCEENNPLENGEIEVDESYFGAKRVKGKRGRGASGKIPVFGLLKRNCKVYTRIVEHCSISEILPIIEAKADKESVIFTDG